MPSQGTLFIISGPSAAGKTTLVKAAVEQLHKEGYAIERPATHTSRPIGKGEQAGSDYIFVTPDEFDRLEKEGFFMEVSREYGPAYGVRRGLLDEVKQGTSLVLVLDRPGTRQILEAWPQAILVWISVGDLEMLRQRFMARGRDSEEAIAWRLEQARKEIEEERVEPMYPYHIQNHDWDKALGELMDLFKDHMKS